MLEQQRFFSAVFNRICDVTTSVSSSFFLLKIPYGISQNRGQMISFLKRKKGEEYRRGLGRMYWQQSLRQINMPATSIMNYGCSDSRIYQKSPSSSFFLFSYTFLTKSRTASAVIKDFRGLQKLNCIRPCKPIYSLSLKFPPILFFFPLYALSCTLYGHSCSYLHTVKYSVQNMMSIKKHPVSRLQRGFKIKQKRPCQAA